MDDVGRYTLRILNSTWRTRRSGSRDRARHDRCTIPDLATGSSSSCRHSPLASCWSSKPVAGVPRSQPWAVWTRRIWQQLLHDGVRGLLDREQTIGPRPNGHRTARARGISDSLVLAPSGHAWTLSGLGALLDELDRGRVLRRQHLHLVGTTASAHHCFWHGIERPSAVRSRCPEVLGDAVIVVDAEFRILRWNTCG